MVKSRRLNVRVTETLGKQLEREARLHGVTMTTIIEAAIQRYFDDEAAGPPEALMLRRLDRIDRSQASAERDMAVVFETLQHFILYWLTVTPPVMEGERDAAQALGRQRMDHFASQMARKVNAHAPPDLDDGKELPSGSRI
ncbi:MAG: hypothetical protein ACPH9E_08450 [Hyphomonas sp.]|jgi:hypothetical protein